MGLTGAGVTPVPAPRAAPLAVAAAVAAAWSPAHAAANSAWLPHWRMDAAFAAVRAHADRLDTASPFWFDSPRCGVVTAPPGFPSRRVTAGLRARGLRVVPSFTATGLAPAAAVACLGNPARRRTHARAVARAVAASGGDGADLDYEHLALTTDPARARRVRRAFTAFAADVCARLRRDGRTCVVTVMPRTDDTARAWRGTLSPAVYDYRALGAEADVVRVMAYDQHAGRTRPGPVAGLPWVRAVAAYAAATVPPERVELGVCTYGRAWSGRSAASLTGPGARSLARRHGARVRFDAAQAESTFRYRADGGPRTVWFCDARSVAARVRVARQRGFRGVALWAAGTELPGVWGALDAPHTPG